MRYSLADLSERMFNRPVAISLEKAQIILGALGPRLNIGSLVVAGDDRVIKMAELSSLAAKSAVDIESRPGDGDMAARDWETGAIMTPYEIWNGVAILKIRGTLMAEGGLNPSSGMTSYAGLDYKLRYARADDRVLGIALDVDSGGGEVVDLFEFCSHLRAAREEKPMRAIVRGFGASAAYAIPCCAGEVTCAPYSLVGSIGALIAHAEFSERNKQEGIGVTLIGSAPHKTDASTAIPLAEDVRLKLQAEVTRTGNTFIAHVAEARGRSVDEIAAQEARFYGGEEAVRLGLVDKIMAWDESLKEFAENVNRRQPPSATPASRSAPAADANRGTARMPDESLAPAAENQPEITQAALDKARTDAVTAERARITQLTELAGPDMGAELAAAISAGTSAGDFAIAMAKAQREQQTAALDGARADATGADNLPQARPDASASTAKPNRGLAAIERMQGRHAGLPAKD